MRKAVWALLAVVAILAPIEAVAALGPARLDPPTLLKRLQQTRTKNLPPDALTQVRVNYQNSRRLCLDLIYYQWVASTTDSTVDIDRLDEIVSALSEHMIDPGVAWANSVLRGTGSKFSTINLQDEEIRALSDLRDAIRLGISNRERSPMRSAEVLSQAVGTCSQRKMDLTGAALLMILGDQYLSMDRYKESERCYEQARGVLREYQASGNLAQVYEDLGTLYSNMRNYAVASESFKSAGDEWAGIGRGDLAGKQYIQSGVALAAQGLRERGVERIMYGLKQSRNWALTHKSYAQLVKDLRDFGDFLLAQNDVLGARDMYLDAVKMAELAKDRESQARVLKELAEVYDQAGDAKSAQETTAKRKLVLKRAAADAQSAVWKTSRKTGQPIGETERLLPIIMLGAWASSELGDKEQSEAFYRQAASLYRRLRMTKEAVHALNALVSVLEDRSQDDKALEAKQEAVTIAESADSKSLLTADTKSAVAEDYASRGRLDMAITVYGQCESIYRGDGAARQLAVTLEKRGDLFLQEKDYSKAADDFREVASIYLEDIGEPWTAAQAYWRLADALIAGGNEKDVTAILSSAVEHVERWCVEQSVDPDLEPLASQILSLLYTRLIPMQVKNGEKQQAWELLRTSERYRWHSRLMTALHAEKNDDLDAMLTEYERVAQSRPGSRPFDLLETKKLAGNWAETVDYALLLRKWYPTYYRSMLVDPLGVARIASDIPVGTVVVDYLFTDSAGFAFVISRSSQSVWQLPATRGRVEELARGFAQIIRDAQDTVASGMPLPAVDWSSEEMKPLLTALTGLYDALINPISNELLSVKNLAFAAPAELAGFPLHALIHLTADGRPRFLVEDFAVGYIGPNSLMDLTSSRVRPLDPAKDRLALFADPSGDLRGAREEADLVQSAFPRCESYIGSKASKENFMLAVKSCAVLHIAAHHELDPDSSKFSILLAPGAGLDGEVTVADLNSMRNSGVSLVVLSTCEALGSASLAADNELMTAELLSVAGFPSVIGGLWKVSDKASSKLMEEFYRALALPVDSKAEALRRAQRALIDSAQFKHPYYWAGFALYGNQS